MSSSAVKGRARGRWRWWFFSVVIFCGQVGLIFCLGEKKPIQPRPPAPAPSLRLTDSKANEIFRLNDPTLFALPHLEGFAGPAWLRIPPAPVRVFEWAEKPAWMELPKEQLGETFNEFVATNQFQPSQNLSGPASELTLPEKSSVTIFPEHSSVRLAGELAQRRLLSRISLSSWPHTDIVTNTVINMVVNAAGQPISVTPLVSSGYKSADDQALTVARSARFAPLNGDEPRTTAPPISQLMWGQMIFEWITLPIQGTNTLPEQK